jgi:Domain of unknown function (DUF4190)
MSYDAPPPPPTYGQPSPYGAPVPQGTNGMAIASLVVGLVSLPLTCLCGVGAIGGIVSIVLGFIARKQIPERGQKGNGLALAGIIMSVVSIALLIVVIILAATGVIDYEANFDTNA